MKKTITMLVLCLCLLPLPVLAETAAVADGTISAGWNLVVDGQSLAANDALYVENDRLLAAGQALCGALQVACTYENGVLTVPDAAIAFTKDAAVCQAGGQETALEVVTREIDGDLFVPVRFLAEALGCRVDFYQAVQEDGAVYASVVLVNPHKEPVVQLLVSEEDENLIQMLQIASAVTNMEAGIAASRAGEHKEWGMLVLASGDPRLVYDDGTLELSDGLDQTVLDLTPYLETLAPDTLALIKNDEEVRQFVTDEAGRIIAFPVQRGDALERFYVPVSVENREAAVTYLDALSKIAKALFSETNTPT